MGRTYSSDALSGQMALDSPAMPQQSPANSQNTHLYRWTYLYLCAEYFQVGWEYIASRMKGHSGL